MQEQRTADLPEKSGKSADDVVANVLRHLSLVDSPPEPEFNRFTRLVCHAAEVPIALVSFVEESAYRQYFKSAKGLPAGLSQTDLDRSFCKIVTRTGEMLAVSDARTDERIRNNPIIDEMGVIAYLGAPISGPSGETLGSLCALDRVPRDWSDNQKRAITDLADCVTDYIALRHARLAKTS
ncbi:GAF domain-containing protein [Lutimaribacter sp. EGI FJ00015]|uniref:GAF domain-containing protein n=1 Tax=Lutimaribacter degradans TaxID=2945989 RepID=A0ACC5ZZX4_9RHOB|nr:GAF domain-containing protein [Lutimaribacter sp. EGI FJ00013]MCM2563743.1 GAF domain-containing protein [Lutimaribacter sp. EGI FJ00013]MCO0614928.1 GAF domain-containing protein [Lutimaribacter sp. EGI FJ00015]MCO0637591.1 GAF domain-containing protein [Lutimaribacter sp. EGI FJ00014]